jgi:uncharacterized membrane protein
MEEHLASISSGVATVIEIGGALLIFYGALEAFVRSLALLNPAVQTIAAKKQLWVRFAMWLLLGLEFELGADIIRTAIAPNWNDIGQLGAIALIRTFLNFFLERDIERTGS